MNSFKYNKVYRKLVNWLNCNYPVFVAKLRFRMVFGRSLNLKSPQDLNEKILWLSLYSDTSEWAKLADKFAVRQYVAEVGGPQYLIPLIGKWNKAEEIDWESLPNSFVMKTNNGCATVLLVDDKSKFDKESTLEKVSQWLKQDTSSSTSEFHYKFIKPCIIAEEYLDFKSDVNQSTSAIDYKIWCFNGKAYYFFVCSNRNSKTLDVSFFDRDWNLHNEKFVFSSHFRVQDPPVRKPDNLSEMIQLAERLSKPFPEVRVDLYNINGKIYFGEMTFTSYGGTMNYYTQECLLEMGSYVDISNIKRVR